MRKYIIMGILISVLLFFVFFHITVLFLIEREEMVFSKIRDGIIQKYNQKIEQFTLKDILPDYSWSKVCIIGRSSEGYTDISINRYAQQNNINVKSLKSYLHYWDSDEYSPTQYAQVIFVVGKDASDVFFVTNNDEIKVDERTRIRLKSHSRDNTCGENLNFNFHSEFFSKSNDSQIITLEIIPTQP